MGSDWRVTGASIRDRHRSGRRLRKCWERFPAEHRRPATETVPRFLAGSLLGLMLNSLVVVIVSLAELPSGFAAILMATLVPGILLGVNRGWAFR